MALSRQMPLPPVNTKVGPASPESNRSATVIPGGNIGGKTISDTATPPRGDGTGSLPPTQTGTQAPEGAGSKTQQRGPGPAAGGVYSGGNMLPPVTSGDTFAQQANQAAGLPPTVSSMTEAPLKGPQPVAPLPAVTSTATVPPTPATALPPTQPVPAQGSMEAVAAEEARKQKYFDLISQGKSPAEAAAATGSATSRTGNPALEQVISQLSGMGFGTEDEVSGGLGRLKDIYDLSGGDVGKTVSNVAQYIRSMGQELGVDPTAYSALTRTHDTGQGLVARLAKGLAPNQFVPGRPRSAQVNQGGGGSRPAQTS